MRADDCLERAARHFIDTWKEALKERSLPREADADAEAVFRLLEGLEIIEITRAVLTRAAQRFPTALGMLDAIHLASVKERAPGPGSALEGALERPHQPAHRALHGG